MRNLFSDNIFLIPVSGKRDQIIFIYALLQVSHPGPNRKDTGKYFRIAFHLLKRLLLSSKPINEIIFDNNDQIFGIYPGKYPSVNLKWT